MTFFSRYPERTERAMASVRYRVRLMNALRADLGSHAREDRRSSIRWLRELRRELGAPDYAEAVRTAWYSEPVKKHGENHEPCLCSSCCRADSRR